MKKRKDKVIKVEFSPRPHGQYRFRYPEDKNVIIDSKTRRTLFDDKLEYPSVFSNAFTVKVKTEQVAFSFRVEGKKNITGDTRYRWNNADIVFILKAFCSPDDNRIILPSGIHDYMLEEKEYVFNTIKALYKGFTPEEYRYLTSIIFIYLCETQGFKFKGKIMGKLVDFFQKYFQKSKWECING